MSDIKTMKNYFNRFSMVIVSSTVMKKIGFLFTLLFSAISMSQTIVPLYENTIALRIFQDGFTKTVEFQEVSEIEMGNDIITYLDTRENFCAFSNGVKTDLIPAVNEFKTSETAVVYNSGPITFMFKDGKNIVLTNFGSIYDVSDSLAVFVNTFDGAVYTRYKGENILMYSFLSGINKLGVLGENTFVFQNVAGDYVLFHRGVLTTLMNTQYHVKIEAGLDVVAFNDPVSNTFAAYDNGEVVDVEDFHVKKYKAGHGFIAYEDINGNLKVFKDGSVETISSFPDFFEVKDSLVVFSEANMLKVYYNGETTTLENFVPPVRVMKNGILAYKNLSQGVTAFISGEKVNVTNEQAGEIGINGNAVFYQNQNNRYVVYWAGKQYY